eukprot:m.738888 g.738888  ORF g.738888 m.738888 type:complete len:421 (+) comp58915_c1_seq2:884-2146(+)
MHRRQGSMPEFSTLPEVDEGARALVEPKAEDVTSLDAANSLLNLQSNSKRESSEQLGTLTSAAMMFDSANFSSGPSPSEGFQKPAQRSRPHSNSDPDHSEPTAGLAASFRLMDPGFAFPAGSAFNAFGPGMFQQQQQEMLMQQQMQQQALMMQHIHMQQMQQFQAQLQAQQQAVAAQHGHTDQPLSAFTPTQHHHAMFPQSSQYHFQSAGRHHPYPQGVPAAYFDPAAAMTTQSAYTSPAHEQGERGLDYAIPLMAGQDQRASGHVKRHSLDLQRASSSSAFPYAQQRAVGRSSNTSPSHMGHARSGPSASAPVSPHVKRRGNLPRSTTEFLKTWLYAHADNPYPTEVEKSELAQHCNLTLNQICNWFINARRRYLVAGPKHLSTSSSRSISQENLLMSGASSHEDFGDAEARREEIEDE